MSTELSLAVSGFQETPLVLTPSGLSLIAEALDASGVIGKVQNATENEQAVAAQVKLKTVIDAFEKARVETKKPVLDWGRKIDDFFKTTVESLKKEQLRIAPIVGNFQQLELAKQRAAEAARLKDLEEIERRKQEELAKANSHEELEAIHERANQEAAMVPVVFVAKAKGQTVGEEWEFEVTDPLLLANAHRNCVNIEPKSREIKALLNAGVKVAGIVAKKVTKAGVRLQRETALIEA